MHTLGLKWITATESSTALGGILPLIYLIPMPEPNTTIAFYIGKGFFNDTIYFLL